MSELGFGDTPEISIKQTRDKNAGEKFIEGKEYVKVYITEQEGFPNYAFLSHNGHAIQVQRGVDVEIPVKYIQVLRDAINYRLVQRVVDSGRGDGSKRTQSDLKPFFVYDWHLVA